MFRYLYRYVVPAALFLGLVLVYAYLGPGGSGPGAGPPAARSVAVERVVDGDTIVVSGYGAKLEHVRLIGVDTPETVAPRKPVQCYGPEASAYTKHLLPKGSSVILRFDAGAPERDHFRRVLAYVWTNSHTMVNLDLVRRGYARAAYYKPHDDYRQLFKSAEAKAKADDKGRWGACGK